MDLSIIIVNYKSAVLISECLETVFTQTAAIDFEVLVVDNQSNDDSEQIIRSRFPAVVWLQMGYNAGFARANNFGIQNSKGAAVLLLNPDTLVLDRSIERSFQDFETSKFVACGVQLINADGTAQIAGNYAMKGGLNYLLPLPFLGRWFKWLGTAVKVKKPNVPDSNSVVEVDWINGAYLMVKRPAIQKAGLLDEDFFLYAEEAEWCSRLKKQGPLCIYGQYKLIHLQGETANETYGSEGKGYFNLFDRKGLQIIVSNFLRIRKEFGVFWYFVLLFFYTLEVPLFYFGLLVQSLAAKKKFHWHQANGFAKNILQLYGYLPKMLLNKRHLYKVL